MVNETETITQVLSGDTNAYEKLVERYHVGLIIHCERLLADRATAEDIAQEAFISAFTRLKTFNASKARFSTWLYRIATNKAIDHLRQQKQPLLLHPIEEIADELAPDFDNEQQRLAVREAVQSLQPSTHQQVIEAYYWQGKSYQEIATIMGVPINTVRTWLHRAKEQLGKELA